MYFCFDIVLVLRYFGGQFDHLEHRGHYPGAQHREGQTGRNQYRGNTPQFPPLQPVTNGNQKEAQQRSQGQRQQDALGQVKNGDHHGQRRQRQHPR